MVFLRNRAILAPMSGITDLPFRKLAHRLGAGLVIAEMAGGKMLVGGHGQTLKKIMGAGEISPCVIQISAGDPHTAARAARIAADHGADGIDINMGCPARKVVRGVAGSALMKEPDLALAIIEKTVNAVSLPVSVKMRLGWDETCMNAPEIAQRAEQAGTSMITVHGRTRNQFYKGRANWREIARVVQAVNIPVIANGDIWSFSDSTACLARSGAHGIMIGRGARGRPWIIGEFGARLAGKKPPGISRDDKKSIMLAHFEDMLGFYGRKVGLRNARKHLGWYVEDLLGDTRQMKIWRSRLFREENPARVPELIERLFDEQHDDHGVVA